MGAFSGGSTFRQYYVSGELPNNWPDTFQEGIARLAFKDIDLKGEEDRALGWCSAAFPLDIDLQPELWRFNEYIVLALRIDTLGVPGPILRIHTEAEIRRVQLEQKRESLNRYEKAEIKERIHMALRARVLPSIKSIDMVWNWTDGTVRFYAGNEKTNLEFQEMFEDSFGLLLIPDTPYTAGLHGQGIKLTDEQKAVLDVVEPSIFVDTETALAALHEGA
jgi:DNA recombination-dependent growth factor C